MEKITLYLKCQNKHFKIMFIRYIHFIFLDDILNYCYQFNGNASKSISLLQPNYLHANINKKKKIRKSLICVKNNKQQKLNIILKRTKKGIMRFVRCAIINK